MVRAVPSADTIRLVAPLPTGADVTNWSVRTGDVVPGQTVLRVDVPSGLTLSQALPGGSDGGADVGADQRGRKRRRGRR